MFNCTGCGACCNRMNNVALLVENIKELKFPYKINEKGRCEMLGIDNQCTVYNNRPLICNIDKMQEYLNIQKEEFYLINKTACNKMILEDGLDKKYLID